MTELHDPSDCAPLRSCLRTPTHNFSPQHVDLSQGHRTWGLKNSTLRNFQSWIITPSGFWRTTNILSFRCIYIHIYILHIGETPSRKKLTGGFVQKFIDLPWYHHASGKPPSHKPTRDGYTTHQNGEPFWPLGFHAGPAGSGSSPGATLTRWDLDRTWDPPGEDELDIWGFP